MISLFGGKADHPMADPREAKRLIEEIQAQEAHKAIEEASHWLESVSSVEGFKLERRVQLLFSIDEAVQPRVRKLSREYLGAARPARAQENRLWTLMHEFWRQAGLAYARCIDHFVQNARGADGAKRALPALLVRGLRSVAQQLKWVHLRYGPVDRAAWGVFSRVYAYAEACKLAQTPAAVYPSVQGDSTPQREFLRGVVFSASSPDSLLPQEGDLAERVIGDLADRFSVAAAAGAEHFCWIDLGQAMAPQRIVRALTPAPGLRCIGAAAARGEVEALIGRIQTSGRVPQELNTGGTEDKNVVLEVLRHLAGSWASAPPERKHPRHPVKSRVSVAHGWEGVVGALDGAASLDFGAAGVENWIVENVSAGGFGAMVPQMKGDWLRVGTLLAMQPEGGNNWLLGLVRRITKTSPVEARIGIETLSKSPLVSQFAMGEGRGAAEQGVLIKTADPGSGEARIVLRVGAFVPGQNLEAEHRGRHHVYLPQGVAEQGEDYEIVRYREMIRES